MSHVLVSNERRAVLIVVLTASFLTPFMVSSVNIALPSIGRDLSMGAMQLSWVTTAYLLCSVIFLIPFGKIADLYGRKRVFFWGIAIVTISSVLSAMARNGAVLIGTRILHGVGAAMVFGTGIAIISASLPQRQRGKVLGFNVSFIYLGLMLGPVIGGFLTSNFGWRSLFLVTIPVGSVMLIIIRYFINTEWVEQGSKSLDWRNTTLYGGSIALVPVPKDPVEESAGMLKGDTSLVKALVDSRKKDSSRGK